MKRYIILNRSVLVLLFINMGLLLSCGKIGPVVQGGARSWETDEPDAILVPGVYPLWFEFGGEGPRQIDEPLAASAPPYAPWPLSRHAAGLLAREGELVLAVNRSGFLVFCGRPGETLALYALNDRDYWSRFTVAALFPFEERAAVLFYRDDFFSDSPGSLPNPRVFALSSEYPAIEALEVPAFSSLPSGWDVEQLEFGNDRKWYFRGVQKDTENGERVYYAASDLRAAPEQSSLGAFQNAGLPAGLDAAPKALAAVLTNLAVPAGEHTFFIAKTLSPLWPMPRYFAFNASPESPDAVELAAWWDGARAYGALPDGRCWYADSDGAQGAFSLPALPESYRYTGFALLGTALVAFWEEQDGVSVGAAGFMVIKQTKP